MFLCCFFAEKLSVKYILNGLLFGAILNIIWAGVDSIYYMIFKKSYTNQIFHTYIVNNGIKYGSISSFEGEMIRPAGFNADPASIGLFAPFVFGYGLYNNNYVMMILGVAGCVFSGITTAAVCCGIIFLLGLIQKSKHFKQRALVNRHRLLFILLSICLGVFLLYKIFPNLVSRITDIFDRINMVYIKESVENLRMTYITEFPTALSNQGIKVLTGSGFNSAAEGYLKGNLSFDSLLMHKTNHAPYDMENLYLAYFFDCGIAGFVIYLVFLGTIYLKLKHIMSEYNNRHYFAIAFGGFLSVVLSSLFYHYTLYSFHILLFVALCLYTSQLKGTGINEKTFS